MSFPARNSYSRPLARSARSPALRARPLCALACSARSPARSSSPVGIRRLPWTLRLTTLVLATGGGDTARGRRSLLCALGPWRRRRHRQRQIRAMALILWLLRCGCARTVRRFVRERREPQQRAQRELLASSKAPSVDFFAWLPVGVNSNKPVRGSVSLI